MAKEGIKYSGVISADGRLHRFQVDDDPKGRRNGWYCLHLDERPAGAFGCNKRWGDKKFSWTAKGLKPLSAEERAEVAQRASEARAKAAAEEAARQEAAKVFAAALWDAATEATTHPYLERKKVASHGLRIGPWRKTRPDGSTWEVATDALLVPLLGPGKVMWGLQAVFSSPVMLGGEERDKDFIFGAKKKGLWLPIGRPAEVDGKLTICLCEGYATGASIYQATGLAVLVCFDAGNLLDVARIVRKAYPEGRLIVCADNDQWTMVRGVAQNTGVIKGTETSKTVDALLAVPWFKNVNTKPTDFNDLACLDGDAEVARQVFATFRKEEPPPAESPPEGAQEAAGGLSVIEGGKGSGENGAAAQDGAKKKRRIRSDGAISDPDAIQNNAWFRILGHDRDNIYVFQAEMRMVIARRQTDWGRNALLTLANMAWWQQNFPGGGKDGFDTGLAINALIRHAFEKGYYDPTRTRGRGAWQDRGRFVVHFGSKLLVDCAECDVTDMESNFVYEQGRHLNMPSTTPMSGEDGAKIIKTAMAFHWTRPASAILLAGWVALAPLCGALRWRPHIWITGGTGSGKSSVLNYFVWPLMNGMEVYAQGNSTEAGIRQTLATDALPVLFEESEQNDERERLRMSAVLSLIRQSSTESAAKTLKGSQTGEAQGFMVRSMFCLASVMVGLRHQADIERIAILNLRPKRAESKDQASKNWEVIKAAVDDLRADPELPGRLVRRSIQLLPITVQNIEVFAKVASDKFGSQREGDQFGALLAGAWSLVKSTVATPDQAKEMINRYDWTEYLENSETEESAKALNTLLEQLIRTPKGDVSVYELIMRGAGHEGEGAYDGSQKDADAILRRHGMMIQWSSSDASDAMFLVAHNNSALDGLIEGTPYSTDLKSQLGRVPGAIKAGPARFNGSLSRAVGIPMTHILGGLDVKAADPLGDDIPF